MAHSADLAHLENVFVTSERFAARDGLFVMQIGREHQFERLAHAVGRSEWLRDPRFAQREGWRERREGGRFRAPSARVAELADAPDLGSGAARRGGSSPSSCTTSKALKKSATTKWILE